MILPHYNGSSINTIDAHAMNRNSLQAPDPFLAAIVFEGGLGLLAVGLGWVLGAPPAERIEWTLDSAASGFLAALPLIAVMWLGIRTQWRPLREILQVLKDNAVPLLRECGPWKLAGIALFAGFGEELLFRGVLQNWVAGLYPGDFGPYLGLIVASVVFGMVHCLTVAYAVLATMIGLYLGGLWIIFGNLLVPALVHVVYDFWALVYLMKKLS